MDAAKAGRRMKLAERRGYACESLEHAKRSILAAAIGACDCNTKTDNPSFHLAYCRWLKLLTAMDKLDTVSDYLREPSNG